MRRIDKGRTWSLTRYGWEPESGRLIEQSWQMARKLQGGDGTVRSSQRGKSGLKNRELREVWEIFASWVVGFHPEKGIFGVKHGHETG